MAALLPLSVTAASAVAGGPSPSTVTTDAVNAYVYGYPLVLMQATEQVSTNVVRPNSTTIQAPVNQFARAANVPGPQIRTVVSPNLDTLYTPAWLDLRAEPMVLHVPNTHGRYYLMPTLSAWTDVIASPGKRTTGTGAGDFVITGPTWHGRLPAGVTQIKSPTNTAWILGRHPAQRPLGPARRARPAPVHPHTAERLRSSLHAPTGQVRSHRPLHAATYPGGPDAR